MVNIHLAALFIGCFLDFLFGDPHFLYHPVCAIGSLISWLEKRLRAAFPHTEAGEKKAGTVLVLLVVLVSTGAAGVLLTLGYHFSLYAGLAIESMICYQMMAWRSLRKESMNVYGALSAGNTEMARKAVSMIVGRDTASLTGEGITKAAVETVAENASDGVIAPLLFMAAFGGLGGVFYKAVNTMDSMIGYRNERYLYLGRVAAKLDDVCNFIPSRLSALFMITAGFLMGWISRERGCSSYSGLRGWKIFCRDRFNHKSPNSAQTEAACAGILGVELAGDAWYFGELHKKPTIGDGVRAVEYEDIRRANRLMTGTYVLALVLVLGVCLWLGLPFKW